MMCRILFLLLAFIHTSHCGSLTPPLNEEAGSDSDSPLYVVPNVVHQTYDYQSPNFFMYLSLKCVQQFLKPDRHLLWVNVEGKHRANQWEFWQSKVRPGSWEHDLTQLFGRNKIEVKTVTFPLHPPGNTSIFAQNKAHRSDFQRMNVLFEQGGIYLDTDAFATSSLQALRVHDFTLSFDNIVNPENTKPLRLNNGVLLSAPNSTYLKLWMDEYRHFNPASFDHDSSVVPWELTTQYPDLVHIEMSRISPISYYFQTSMFAEAITCGILDRPAGAIWHPVWSTSGKGYTYSGVEEGDRYLFRQARLKRVLHMTMSQVRGICMLRKNLNSAQDLDNLPSYLGSIFRLALHGRDDFDYKALIAAPKEAKRASWKRCRDAMGMHATPDPDDKARQQYTRTSLFALD